MAKDNSPNDWNAVEAKIAKALADAEAAKRRATMALQCAKIAIKYTISTPKITALLKDVDEELRKP
ncbi:MAG TPA: hypothetical protein VLT36_21990 [Candidatus Dormibacteraeota bacterium]|nr:hypothetical protein [Candidatus Dormibacteraeota bacterium]